MDGLAFKDLEIQCPFPLREVIESKISEDMPVGANDTIALYATLINNKIMFFDYGYIR